MNLFVHGGGYHSLTDLNDAGTADFRNTGFNVGGGVSVDLSRLQVRCPSDSGLTPCLFVGAGGVTLGPVCGM